MYFQGVRRLDHLLADKASTPQKFHFYLDCAINRTHVCLSFLVKHDSESNLQHQVKSHLSHLWILLVWYSRRISKILRLSLQLKSSKISLIIINLSIESTPLKDDISRYLYPTDSRDLFYLNFLAKTNRLLFLIVSCWY